MGAFYNDWNKTGLPQQVRQGLVILVRNQHQVDNTAAFRPKSEEKAALNISMVKVDPKDGQKEGNAESNIEQQQYLHQLRSGASVGQIFRCLFLKGGAPLQDVACCAGGHQEAQHHQAPLRAGGLGLAGHPAKDDVETGEKEGPSDIPQGPPKYEVARNAHDQRHVNPPLDAAEGPECPVGREPMVVQRGLLEAVAKGTSFLFGARLKFHEPNRQSP